jgi:hypothetical protein
LLDTILRSEAVSLEAQRLDVADLVLLGVITGAWPRFECEVSRGLALERDAGGASGFADLTASATEFRYARGLTSAREFTYWLTARKLTVEDLSGVLGRALLREQMSDGDREVEVGELAGVLGAEAFCGGVFDALARAGIERLVAAHGLGQLDREVMDGRVEASLATAIGLRAAGIAALGVDEVRRRLRRLWAYEDARSKLRQQVAEPDALRHRLADHGLDWLRVEGWRLRFRIEGAAREARALMTDDGQGVEEVSAIAGAVATEDSVYLYEVPEQIAGALAATAPGEVAAPWLQDEEWNVLLVVAKVAPSIEDPFLRERAADELLAAVLRRQSSGLARVHSAF